MRLQDIEEAAISDDPGVLDMYHKIYQNCQPFLQEINNDPQKNKLYRGMNHLQLSGNDNWDLYGIKDVRLDGRKPTDTSREDHANVNKILNSLYGHPYRNGLFVSGSYGVAESYGRAYVIFPIGKFDYIWHESIRDLFSAVLDPEIDAQYRYWNAFADDMFEDDISNDEKWALIADKYNTGDLLSWVLKRIEGPYETTNLIKGIHRERTEIMIWVRQYYYMHPKYLMGFKAFLSK